MSESRTEPRTVLVVGATSGIGLAAARLLRERGDRVLLVARDAGRLAQVAAELGGVPTHAADVAERDDVEAALAAAVAAFGRVDGVVTSAQVMAYGTLEQVPADVLSRVVSVAVDGVTHLAQTALPHFREHGGGSLVVVGSLLGEISVPSMGAYCTAKAAQHAQVRALQIETRRERGIGVSLVVPGAVDTPIYRQAGTWAGHGGFAPPPVVAPERVAQACVDRLDRPRRATWVGPGSRLARTGYWLAPGVYDRLAPVLVDRVVLRGPTVADHSGNVWEARPALESERDGWTAFGIRRGQGR